MRAALRAGAPILSLVAAPVAAASWACTLSGPCPDATACPDDPVRIAFDIDPGQFAPPVGPSDPPRRRLTSVTLNGETFDAEPIRMAGGIRGFWGLPGPGSDRILLIEADGAARYDDPARQGQLTGTCKTIASEGN